MPNLHPSLLLLVLERGTVVCWFPQENLDTNAHPDYEVSQCVPLLGCGLRTRAACGMSLLSLRALWKVTIYFSSVEPLAQQMGHAGEIFLLDKQLAKINYSEDKLCRTLAL